MRTQVLRLGRGLQQQLKVPKTWPSARSVALGPKRGPRPEYGKRATGIGHVRVLLVHGALGTLSGLTTTSRALGVGASVKTKAIEHIKNGGYTGRVGAGALNLEGLAIAPTTPTALARHGLRA